MHTVREMLEWRKCMHGSKNVIKEDLIFQEETLDATSKAGDTKEGLNIGRERPADDPLPLSGPNQWPSEVSKSHYPDDDLESQL